MKHIKAKFHNEKPIPEGALKRMEHEAQKLQLSDVHKLKIPKDNKYAYLFTERNTAITSFIAKIDGLQYFIPEPDPVLIYFNNAQSNFRNIESSREELKKGLEFKEGHVGIKNIEKPLFAFLYYSTGFVIFLFTAIETMINKSVKLNYVYRTHNGKFTNEYNFEEIQRWISFYEKIEKVLMENTGLDFPKAHPVKFQHVRNLKELRDIIIHTKIEKDKHTPYSEMIKLLLNFKYKETIFAVRDFINYYHPSLVEECNCGKDF